MVQDGKFTGQGHLYYVAPDGTRYFDYGLDVDKFSTQIPEFGFNKHFMQISPSVTVTFDDLLEEKDAFLNVVAMGRIIQGPRENPKALVTGWVTGIRVNDTIPLSWVRIEAVNSTASRFAPTLDGRYDLQGALNLPAGTYNVTFSVAFYQPQTQVAFAVQWNATYTLLPPLGPLCPTADPSVCSAAASSPQTTGLPIRSMIAADTRVASRAHLFDNIW
jgi:hypothetical protein